MDFLEYCIRIDLVLGLKPGLWTVVVVTALFQSVSYAGEDRRYVYASLPRPVGLSLFGADLYWADASLKKVSIALLSL